MAGPIRYPTRFTASIRPGNRQGLWLSDARWQIGVAAALTAVTTFCMLVTGWPASGKADTHVEVPAHLWIAYGPQTRTPDGAVTQRLYIRRGGRPDDTVRVQAGDLPDLLAFYRFGNRRGLEPVFHSAPILRQDGDLYLDISCPAMARVEVIVTQTPSDRRGAIQLTAQTAFFLFGKAAAYRYPAAADPHPLPQPPLHLRPAPGQYWMQTGATYAFTYRGPNPAAAAVSVLENHRKILTLAPDVKGAFAYTPSHDPRLDRAGPDAGKQTVLVVHSAAGESKVRSTYTLLLHRSRHGHLRRWPGLALFGFTAAAIGLVVRYQRRRRSY